MKRAGNLWPRVLERGNLARAFHQAARGKRRKLEVRRFEANLDENLERLRWELEARTFETGRFTVFTIHEPKKRTIHAARFPERVFQHALMNLCEPVLERQSAYHSYACRKGKGRLAGVEAAQKAARRGAWHLKLDVRKYFESIPHELVIGRLYRVFKDPDVLYWLERIIRGHRRTVGRGLPIGSLSSQHLANFYLGPLDRLCLGLPGVMAYVRYMDDFVCWAGDKRELHEAGRRIRRCLEEELGLNLKHSPCPQRSTRGMDFLGYRVFPDHTELNRRSKTRFRRRLRMLHALHESGDISEAGLQERLTALTAFVRPTRSYCFRRRVLEQIRVAAIGHEPGEPGRQLEQQRDQLPHCEPQQQQPGQHEQQCRVPPRPQLRPHVSDGTAMSPMGLNRPLSRSYPSAGCDKNQNHPSGAGRPADVGSKAPGGSSLSQTSSVTPWKS